MALPKLGEKKILWNPNCGNAIAEIGRKKNCFGKNEKKKCYEICERVKKSCHVHNIFTTFSQ